MGSKSWSSSIINSCSHCCSIDMDDVVRDLPTPLRNAQRRAAAAAAVVARAAYEVRQAAFRALFFAREAAAREQGVRLPPEELTAEEMEFLID